MNVSIAWAAVAVFLSIVAVNAVYVLGFLHGVSSGQKLGKTLGKAQRVQRAREFASSIGRN